MDVNYDDPGAYTLLMATAGVVGTLFATFNLFGSLARIFNGSDNDSLDFSNFLLSRVTGIILFWVGVGLAMGECRNEDDTYEQQFLYVIILGVFATAASVTSVVTMGFKDLDPVGKKDGDIQKSSVAVYIMYFGFWMVLVLYGSVYGWSRTRYVDGSTDTDNPAFENISRDMTLTAGVLIAFAATAHTWFGLNAITGLREEKTLVSVGQDVGGLANIKSQVVRIPFNYMWVAGTTVAVYPIAMLMYGNQLQATMFFSLVGLVPALLSALHKDGADTYLDNLVQSFLFTFGVIYIVATTTTTGDVGFMTLAMKEADRSNETFFTSQTVLASVSVLLIGAKVLQILRREYGELKERR